MMTPLRLLAYMWAAPVTALGLLAGALTLMTGGKGHACQGVLEFTGGFARGLLSLPFVQAQAMTLGHVLLGQDALSLSLCRNHEHGHVRQVERWGPFFLPAYFLASLWAVLTRRHYYHDNYFERDADRWAGRP